MPTQSGAAGSCAPDRWWWWALIAVAWFATLGWRPLLEPDEARYAEIPREMWVSGDWVTPRLNGVKYFEKPPLQYWATAAFYSLFGSAEWTARLWACALAFLCIPLTYAFARHLYASAPVAAAAAAALALNPYFLILGQINLLDSALCFFLVGSMFSFLRARDAPAGSGTERKWMLLCSLALGLSVLTKGPVALALAGGAWLIHALVTREWRSLERWHLAVTVPVFLAVTVPWFLVVSQRNPEFPQFFFIHEHLARYTTDEANHLGAWWFFLPYALLAVLPWIGRVWPALRGVFDGGARNPANSTRWFLLIWCALLLAFFSASHSKLPPYIMPIMPAFAVLLAPAIASSAGAIRRGAWIACGVIVVIAAGLLIAAARRAVPGPPLPLISWAAVAIAVALAGAAFAPRGWVPAAIGSILGMQALIMSYSHFPPPRTAKSLVAQVRPLIGPQTQLFSVDQYRQSVPPYLGRPLRVAIYRGELDFGLSQEPASFIPTLDAFAAEWMRSTDALAFVSPAVLNRLREQGVPYRVRAADGRSVVVSRQ